VRRDLADFRDSPWAVEPARLGWTEIELYASTPTGRMLGLTVSASCKRLTAAGSWN
jgi:hypothetical protein